MQQESYGKNAEEGLLVQKAVNGDPEAFGRLYDMHVERVYRHVYYRVGNTADAGQNRSLPRWNREMAEEENQRG